MRQPRPTNPIPASLGQPVGTKNRIEVPPMTTIMERASHFTLRETHLFFSQSSSKGPNNSLRKSQACIRGDDLAKQAAASITNGVVGKSGKTTPMPPSKRKNRPVAIQRYKSCYRLLSPLVHLPVRFRQQDQNDSKHSKHRTHGNGCHPAQ